MTPSPPPSPQLEQLALILARNYFDTSQTQFAPGSRDRVQLVFSGESSAALARRAPQRTVLVLGPDASAGAFGKRDMSPATVIRLLRQEINRDKYPNGATDGAEPEPDDPARHDRALADLIREHGEARVREALFAVYGSRHRPHLAFEVIAHMFRHRFLDAIINLSPDELLDEAIEGEMGTAEYRHVCFEAECTGIDPLVVDRRLKIPLYVKPQGTLSYPNSIRLLPDPGSPRPGPMHRLMASIVGGHYGDARTDQYVPYHVNLVTMGDVTGSEAFRSILRGGREPGNGGITVYHMRQKDEARPGMLEGEEWEHLDVQVVEETRDDLAGGFRKLWDRTSEQFREGFGPRGIARHELIHNLFYAGPREGRPGMRVPGTSDLDYFRGRLLAEVAIAIARGNGQIDLGTMAESRVGTTFDLMRNASGGGQLSMLEILRSFSDSERVTFEGPDNSAFRFRYTSAGTADQLNQNMAAELWEALRNALDRVGDGLFQHHLSDIRDKEVRTTKMVKRFGKLASSDAHDISPSFRDRHLLLAKHQRARDVIHTSLALTLRFVEMVKESWDLMLAISETGKVMDHYARHVRNDVITDDPRRRFCLILAGNDHPEIAARRLERNRHRMVGLSDPPLFYVPEWAHNQHMVLLLKRDGATYKPISAVRYETPRLGSRVNPVFIGSWSGTDLDGALECFKRYLHMSVAAYRPGTTDAHATSRDDLRQLSPQALWERLLEQNAGPRPTKPDPAPGHELPDSSEPPEPEWG